MIQGSEFQLLPFHPQHVMLPQLAQSSRPLRLPPGMVWSPKGQSKFKSFVASLESNVFACLRQRH